MSCLAFVGSFVGSSVFDLPVLSGAVELQLVPAATPAAAA